jgi:hypothetical protein
MKSYEKDADAGLRHSLGFMGSASQFPVDVRSARLIATL